MFAGKSYHYARMYIIYSSLLQLVWTTSTETTANRKLVIQQNGGMRFPPQQWRFRTIETYIKTINLITAACLLQRRSFVPEIKI